MDIGILILKLPFRNIDVLEQSDLNAKNSGAHRAENSSRSGFQRFGGICVATD